VARSRDPRRQRGGRVINRARPCVVWVAISRAAGRRRDFDCNDRYRSPQRRRSGQGSKACLEVGSRRPYPESRGGASDARCRLTNSSRGATAGAHRRAAARQARRVTAAHDDGTSRLGGVLTGVITLGTVGMWRGGVLTRGPRARTPPEDGPARDWRRERDDPGPDGALAESEAQEPRRPGPNTTHAMRRVAARYRPTRLASTTRNRSGRGT
jgi:hypothetical protein